MTVSKEKLLSWQVSGISQIFKQSCSIPGNYAEEYNGEFATYDWKQDVTFVGLPKTLGNVSFLCWIWLRWNECSLKQPVWCCILDL